MKRFTVSIVIGLTAATVFSLACNGKKAASVPIPKRMNCGSAVTKRKIQPTSATNAGSGYNQIRNGRSISGRRLRRILTAAIWLTN